MYGKIVRVKKKKKEDASKIIARLLKLSLNIAIMKRTLDVIAARKNLVKGSLFTDELHNGENS